MFLGMKQDSLSQTIVEVETNTFVQEIRSKGYIDKNMYEEYLKNLSTTGILYDIEIVHNHNSLEPEYRFRSEGEVIDEHNKSYVGTNEYHYWPISTEIPHIEDPIDNSGNLNSETNESIMANAIDDPADSAHIHDESCYGGHKHMGENYFIHDHAHNSRDCKKYVQSIYYDVECHSCGEDYRYNVARYYWDGSRKTVFVDSTGINICFYCNSRSLIVSNALNSYGYSCDYEFDFDGDGLNDDIPYNIVYQYKKSFPQPRDVKTNMTYTSGCYKYHEHGSIGGNINNLFNYGAYSFCTLPSGIELKYKYGTLDTSYYTLNFYPIYNDGILTFACSGGTNISVWDSFPTVDYATFYSLVKDSKVFQNFLKTYSREQYVSSGSVSVLRMTGSLDICDESIHDTWYTICGYEEDITHDCDKIIDSIIATHQNQTIYINDPLITTVRATYKDGSKKTIICTTDFNTSNVVSNKQAILSYNYEIDGTPKIIQTTITVSTILRSKTCQNGHVYNLNSDNTDPGCPFCRGYLQSLVVYYPSSGNITIYKGTTLEENEVTLLATYMDGRKEYIKTEYIDNLDKDYIGTQTATLSYKGMYTYLSVIIKRNLKLCPICNRYYELYPDNSDPGCPYCAALTPIFTGNILEYENEYFETHILKELYEGKEVYYFSNKDYLLLTVTNRTNGWGRGLIKNIFKSLGNEYINVVDGGYIREEVEK